MVMKWNCKNLFNDILPNFYSGFTGFVKSEDIEVFLTL